MNDWPNDDTEALAAYYGVHVLGSDGRPMAAWERENLVYIRNLPYRMVLAWDLPVPVTRIRVHRRCAESLLRCLTRIGAECTEWRGRHLFGGTYNYRPRRGGHALSTHAWGAAIDLDPERNALGRPYLEGAGMMPAKVISIFDDEGWRWGGTFSTPDCMHFQAAR